MAHRRNHGRHPRALRTRETARERQGRRAHHERRGHAQVPAEHQAMFEFCADAVAARGRDAVDGIGGYDV